jgi:hypothetical protein
MATLVYRTTRPRISVQYDRYEYTYYMANTWVGESASQQYLDLHIGLKVTKVDAVPLLWDIIPAVIKNCTHVPR